MHHSGHAPTEAELAAVLSLYTKRAHHGHVDAGTVNQLETHAWCGVGIVSDLLGSHDGAVRSLGAVPLLCDFHNWSAVLEKAEELRFSADSMLAALVLVKVLSRLTQIDDVLEDFELAVVDLRPQWEMDVGADKCEEYISYLRCTRYCATNAAKHTDVSRARLEQCAGLKAGPLAAGGIRANNAIGRKCVTCKSPPHCSHPPSLYVTHTYPSLALRPPHAHRIPASTGPRPHAYHAASM